MNQKGEITLLSCLCILAVSTLVLLCSWELRTSFKKLQRRTDLFLCAKETKGELNEFLVFMGRTNWAIKNINKASLIMAFIPGLQGAALDAQKAKKYLKHLQNARLILFFTTLKKLKQKNCLLDPRLMLTPFKLGSSLFERDLEGAAVLRKNSWDYIFFSKPYFIQLNIQATSLENLKPRLTYEATEKLEKFSSPSYSL